MAHRFTDDEVRAFLLAEPARTAVLATVRADGRAHAAPIWFDVDDNDDVIFTTGAASVKGTNLARTARACLCIDDERPPFGFVVIDGAVTLSDDPDQMLHWATRIGGRYMGAEAAGAFGRRNAAPGEVLVRVTPVKVAGAAGISD